MNSNEEPIRSVVRQAVENADLMFFGICDLDFGEAHGRFLTWLEAGMQAGMTFLERQLSVRQDPQQILSNARSAIVIGASYAQAEPHTYGRHNAKPRVAQYARYRDYHKFIWSKGADVATEISQKLKPIVGDIATRVLADSAPFYERAAAAKCVSGFIGKNTMFIHPKLGSLFVLGIILVSEELPNDKRVPVDPNQRAASGGCGTCERCQLSCPTGALDRAYNLDARKCLAYWSIEHRGVIPIEYWQYFKIYFFGCDICQLVCPYNRGDRPAPTLAVHTQSLNRDLYEIAFMSQNEYETWFGGSPMTRAKRAGLRRNAIIALTVGNDSRLGQLYRELRDDNDQVIRETIEQAINYRQV